MYGFPALGIFGYIPQLRRSARGVGSPWAARAVRVTQHTPTSLITRSFTAHHTRTAQS